MPDKLINAILKKHITKSVVVTMDFPAWNKIPFQLICLPVDLCRHLYKQKPSILRLKVINIYSSVLLAFSYLYQVLFIREVVATVVLLVLAGD